MPDTPKSNVQVLINGTAVEPLRVEVGIDGTISIELKATALDLLPVVDLPEIFDA